MWRDLKARELGAMRPGRVSNNFNSRRLQNLELCTHKEIVSTHTGGVNSLQVDATEGRYLLAGSSDGSAACYDTLLHSSFDPASCSYLHDAIFKVDKSVPRGHKFAVSSVQWYPVDTGLFVTGSFDHQINVWDTNNLQVELQFAMLGKVHSVSMSQVATSHMLIAAGSDDARVRLCDIASGAFTHTLTGHRDAVWAVQWSVSSEWILYSGSCDGAIRFWDIRRAGCHKVLDQNTTQMGRRPPVLKSTTYPVRAAPSEVAKSSPKKLLKTASGKSTKALAPHGKSIVSEATVAKRIHPGLASEENRATAHYGAVKALTATNDGQYLVSAGNDSRVKLWDIESGCNTLVNYESTRIRGNRTTQLSVSPDSSLIFVPQSTVIQVYDLWTGRLQKALRGHYDTVNCCEFHPYEQEMYTGSNDRKILLWGPPRAAVDDDLDEDKIDLSAVTDVCNFQEVNSPLRITCPFHSRPNTSGNRLHPSEGERAFTKDSRKKKAKNGGAGSGGAFKTRPDEDAWSD